MTRVLLNSCLSEKGGITKPERSLPPFLKWAGGKRWLVHNGVPLPKEYRRLVEPFVGSGAIFFAHKPHSALIADANEELINLYTVIRDYPITFQERMHSHQAKHSDTYYYEMRSKTFADRIDRASRMLYLNRTCWNGLYRVNKKGEFNVPKGTKSTVIMDGEDFKVYSDYLQRAEIHCQDFEITINNCSEGDFIFVDPPYTVKHKSPTQKLLSNTSML